jgi:hypothetical protein
MEKGTYAPCRAPPRDGGASRPLGADAHRASLVGLVRALPRRVRMAAVRGWQQPPPTGAWRRSFMFFRDDAVQEAALSRWVR